MELTRTGIPAIMNLPYYLEKIKYRTPTDPAGNFSDRFGTGFWGFMEDLEQGRTFSIVQASVHEMVPPVNLVVSYPVVELLHDFPADFETPLLVDVGGGTGSDLRLCQRALPPPYNTNAKLILQDLPSVIEDAQRKLFLTNIIPMAHDFFTPQPIKGARAYFMNHVLHDWPDAEVCKILMNLRPAMKPGFSKLLLGENEMREERVSTITAALDLCMMALFSAKERTMRDWEVVLGSAGFRIVKVWRDMNTIIEAEAVEGWESG